MRQLSDFDDELLANRYAHTSIEALNSTASAQEMVNGSAIDEESYRHEADKVALILPRITAVVSLLAIACVAIEAWKDLAAEKRRNIGSTRFRTVTHIQLFYQIPQFCLAMPFALGTWPVPSFMGVWGAVGNQATCTAQGLMFQFGVHGTIGWDFALSLTYLMMVRYNVPDFVLLGWLKYFHIVIWLFAVSMCIYPLMNQMYSFTHSMCWLESYPNNCSGDECIRGEGAEFWQNLASFLMTLHLIYSISVMISLYCSIRSLENKNQRNQYLENHGEEASTVSRRNSRAVGIQGILYASGMLITTLPMTMYVLLWNISGVSSSGFFVFANSVIPLIGYVNFLIFIRKRSTFHTRYGKLLRKAHGWIFDYRLRCNCSIECLRLGRGKQDATAPTTNPDNNLGGSGVRSPEQTKGGEDLIAMENGHVEGDMASSPWSGFIIAVKRALWVSELGASQCTSECDRFDNPPAAPVRRKSSDAKAPKKPVRLASEVLNLESTVEAASEPGKSKPCNDASVSSSNPPTKPVRLESCLEGVSEEFELGAYNDTNDSDKGHSAPSKPMRLESCMEAISEEFPLESRSNCIAVDKVKSPPAKPVRLESTMEEISEECKPETGSCLRVLHKGTSSPSKPFRVESTTEVDSEEFTPEPRSSNTLLHKGKSPPPKHKFNSLPSKPVRLESSTETGSEEFQLETGKHSRCLVNSKDPPSKPVRLESTMEDVSEEFRPETRNSGNILHKAKSPPSKPVRLESSAEAVSEEFQVGARNQLKGSAPPSKPMRLESCFEAASEEFQRVHQVDTSPAVPMRFASEIEVSARDEDLASSTSMYENEIEV